MYKAVLPRNLPAELAATAFTTGAGAAWPPDSVAKVIKWLGQNAFAVLGTELWTVDNSGAIRPSICVNGQWQIHGNAVFSKPVETWDAYVTRSVEETLRYVNSLEIPPEAKQYGRIFINVTWVNEDEYLSLTQG